MAHTIEILLPAVELSVDDDSLSFKAPRNRLWEISALLGKYNHFASVTLKKPFKPRTTGDRSQSHRINGHVAFICGELGYSGKAEFDHVKTALKIMARSRGYPGTEVMGEWVPKSESEISTEEAGWLIESINQFAAENGMRLPE